MGFTLNSNSLAGLQGVYDGGTPAQKAAFQSSVSGAVNVGPTVLGLFGDSRTYYSHVTDGGTLGVTYPAQEVATTRDDLSANGVAHHMQVVSGGQSFARVGAISAFTAKKPTRCWHVLRPPPLRCDSLVQPACLCS